MGRLVYRPEQCSVYGVYPVGSISAAVEQRPGHCLRAAWSSARVRVYGGVPQPVHVRAGAAHRRAARPRPAGCRAVGAARPTPPVGRAVDGPVLQQPLRPVPSGAGAELWRWSAADRRRRFSGLPAIISGAATLLLVFRIPALTAAGVGGGATSFIGLVALFRGLQTMGVPKASLAAQQSLNRAPGAALSAARHPVTTVSQEWREIANSPAGQAVSAAGRAASSVGARLRDAAVVRRGI